MIRSPLGDPLAAGQPQPQALGLLPGVAAPRRRSTARIHSPAVVATNNSATSCCQSMCPIIDLLGLGATHRPHQVSGGLPVLSA